MSYLNYADSIKSTKKFKTVLTSAIRLHPTKPELWLYAAKWCLEKESDINAARSYMQRGARFCTTSALLWIEYARLEMIFLAKISARRKILGLDAPVASQDSIMEDEEEQVTKGDVFVGGEDEITLALPEMKTSSLNLSMVEGVQVDTEAVQDPMETPALNGAIPIAIFDNAKKQPFYTPAAAENFFNMFAAFTQVHCQAKIVQHVLDSMTEQYPTEVATSICFIRQPMIGLDPRTAKFAAALQTALKRLSSATEKTKDKALLSKKMSEWLNPILALEELDPAIQMALRHMLKKLES